MINVLPDPIRPFFAPPPSFRPYGSRQHLDMIRAATLRIVVTAIALPAFANYGIMANLALFVISVPCYLMFWGSLLCYCGIALLVESVAASCFLSFAMSLVLCFLGYVILEVHRWPEMFPLGFRGIVEYYLIETWYERLANRFSNRNPLDLDTTLHQLDQFFGTQPIV